MGLEAILNPMYAKDNFFHAKEVDVDGFAILSKAWPFFSEIGYCCNCMQMQFKFFFTKEAGKNETIIEFLECNKLKS